MPTTATLRVQEVMTREPVCAERSTTIRELARMFEEFEISGVPVIDQEGSVIGVVTKTDLIRRCSEGSPDAPPGSLFELLSDEAGEDTELIPEPLIVVEDFMSSDPLTVGPEDSVQSVARAMADARVHRAIVVDAEKHPVGIVTSLDLLKVLAG